MNDLRENKEKVSDEIFALQVADFMQDDRGYLSIV